MQKVYTTIILLLLLSVTAFKASGQRGGAPPGYNQMMMNMSMNMTMNQMMNQHWYYGFNDFQNNKYTFKVTMKDNTVREIKSKIYADTALHKSYLIYVNKNLASRDPARQTKIYSDQTLKISREKDELEGGGDVTGFATDSCWLFKVITGKINAYSHLSEIQMINGAYLRAFQVGDGLVQKLDSATLAPVIKDNPKALKAFVKKDYYKAINKYNGD